VHCIHLLVCFSIATATGASHIYNCQDCVFILQGGYIWHLFSPNADYVNAAASVGSHFIFNNLLHFAFVMLFVRSHLVWADHQLLQLVVALLPPFCLASLRPSSGCLWTLSWSFAALYWNGAIAFHAKGLAGPILANITVWGILGYGLFSLVTFKVSIPNYTLQESRVTTPQDYTIGFSLSVLSASLGVRQVMAFQWIFAFTIMATFVATCRYPPRDLREPLRQKRGCCR
jgi:hypothetical protein